MRKFFAFMNKPMRWQTGVLVFTWPLVIRNWDWLIRTSYESGLPDWLVGVLFGGAFAALVLTTGDLIRNRVTEWQGKRQQRIDEANSVWPPPAPPQTSTAPRARS